jgi:hypothetical protein
MSVDREVHSGRPRSDRDCRSQLKKNKPCMMESSIKEAQSASYFFLPHHHYIMPFFSYPPLLGCVTVDNFSTNCYHSSSGIWRTNF